MRFSANVVLMISLGLVVPSAQRGIDDRSRPQMFEVASVRHNTSAADRGSFNRSPGRFIAINIQLQSLILMAYNIDGNLARFLVVGGKRSSGANCTSNCSSTEQILTAHFDVNATIPEGASSTQEALMLRELLTERFSLKARVEKREIPVYWLVVARAGQLGSELRKSAHNCIAWARARRDASFSTQVPEPRDARGRGWCTGDLFSRAQQGVIIRRSAGEISSLVNQIRGDLDRPIIDRTGLTGNFEWELASEYPGLRGLLPNLEAKAPSLDIALQEQLGLRLVPQTAPFEVLVIESVKMPTPN